MQTKKKKHGFLREMRQNGFLYLLTLPGIIFFLVFSYTPMLGLVMAFQDYSMRKGVFGSSFNGVNNFKFLFQTGDIWRVTGNTLFLNVLFIFFTTLMSVFLAILFSEVKNRKFKRITQTISILPNFVPWTVIALFLDAFIDPTTGMVAKSLAAAGAPVDFYANASIWPGLLVFLKIWQGAGYGAIVYIATIVGIDPQIYEAADIDGATRLQKIFRITLPILKPTIILMSLFSVGRIFYGDFGMIYALVGDNSLLFSTTDVIDTYVYRMMRMLRNYGMSSATGMFQSVLGFVFIITVNWIARKLDPESALF
ncbi:MAG: sugar ABC transporter permease [Clostridia bacterium]|nr:sugar ABC transporter permease [Clostridia bacterium]